jgi:hypothetical protein
MVVFRPGLNYWYWKVLLWIIYLDMHREITLQVVAAFASLNLSLPFRTDAYDALAARTSSPISISCAAELLCTM